MRVLESLAGETCRVAMLTMEMMTSVQISKSQNPVLKSSLYHFQRGSRTVYCLAFPYLEEWFCQRLSLAIVRENAASIASYAGGL